MSNDLYDSPIHIDHAASMLKRPIPSNERPYTVSVLKKNDMLVDKWKNEVLRKIADERENVNSGFVWRSWELFTEGLEVLSIVDSLPRIHRLTPEEKEYWMSLLELPITELYDHGKMMVAYAWGCILNELKIEVALKKKELVYCDNDYEQWLHRAKTHKVLFEQGLYPFWSKEVLDDVSKKVSTILQLPVKIQNQ
jgi:hypothetical protein